MVFAIGFAIVAFLLGDLMGSGITIFGGNPNEIGRIDGESIDYQSFNSEVEANKNNMAQQMGGNISPQMTTYIVENVWNQNISKKLLSEEIERIGLDVGRNELNDLVSGQNPSQMLVPYFTNPETGEFDRTQLNIFLNNIQNEPANSEQKQQWGYLLEGIKINRLQEKYNRLIENSVYITSLEAQEDFTQRNKLANFSYVLLDYSSIPDNDIKPTEADYKNYYNEHKAAYKNVEETRSMEFVIINANPTHQDSLQVKNEIDERLEGLRTAENDSLYASINSETKYPITYRKRGTLDAVLDSAIFAANKGDVVGPFLNNGVYEIAKVLDSRMSPDSVDASHILLNPAMEGGIDKAEAKADSLKSEVQKGKSFALLAAEFGTDGSRENGGELGTFARGAMIPEFEEAVFNGKPGDLLVIKTQFGVHLVKINSQKGSSRVVKAAIIDRGIRSSNQTLQEGYAKAADFFGKATKDNFETLAKENGLTVHKEEHILPMHSQILDLENPRELIRWAFKAKEGSISDKVYEIDSKYVVAKLTAITPKGIAPLASIKNEIEPLVITQLKAAKLNEQVNTALAGASTLDQVAQKLNKAIVPVENIVFANPIIPGIAQENKVVGTVFGLQPSKLSKAIDGVQGVYVVSVKDFVNPETPSNLISQKQQMRQSLRQRIPGATFQALLDKADITDNRAQFY
jgi:peptidyl-prolyl cis-trans isomerase D